MRKFAAILGGSVAAVLISMAGLRLILPHRGYWILSFEPSESGGTRIKAAVKKGTVGTYLSSERMLDAVTKEVELRSQNETLPIGRIEFFDATLPPGRVIIDFKDAKLDLMEREPRWNPKAVP